MNRIIEKGAIISEYPPGTKPDANHFPMRNRLISAWCKKLLVVEAGERSGSLLTAAFAKKQNRQVFAAPNSIYRDNKIAIGDDLTAPIGDDLTALEKVILLKIESKHMSLGDLLLVLKEDKSDIIETISIMELKGKVINVGGIFKKARI